MVIRENEYASDTDFTATLKATVKKMAQLSGASIVAIYPYDEEAELFYAPTALGLDESGLVLSTSDMMDQWRRYRTDKQQGKTPDKLQPFQYGPSAYLIATGQPIITADARADIDSSFVRRNKIRSMISLPLVANDHLIGLLYLNYCDDDPDVDVTDKSYLKKIQAGTTDAAHAIDEARRLEELTTLQSLSGIVAHFAAVPAGVTDGGGLTLRLEAALHRILVATHLDAGALYVPGQNSAQLQLVSSYGCHDLAADVPTLAVTGLEQIPTSQSLKDALAKHELHPLVAMAPRGKVHQGVLVLADHNPFALERRLPSNRTLLQTATDLIGTMLDNGRLVGALDETNRTLGAVSRLSTRLLQPGATRARALQTAVQALTDPSLPELNFEFANVFQIEDAVGNNLRVTASAGSAVSTAMDYLRDANSASGSGIPRWVEPTQRVLAPKDVLTYVATRRRTVVIAAESVPDDDLFVTGYPEDRIERLLIAIRQADGTDVGTVRAARLRESADRAPLRSADDTGAVYRATDEFTVDADIYRRFGHENLVRVFIPLGSNNSGERAGGVLEVGYHITNQSRFERVQIEALRACAATVAVAIETARLYEQVMLRAEQLEIVSEVGRAIATSIDLEQTLSLVARNMARVVNASVCFIALLEEDDSAWYGAAASDHEELWSHRRVERPDKSVVFEAVDRHAPLTVEDAEHHELVASNFAKLLGVRSLLALPLILGDGRAIGAVVIGQRDRQRIFAADEIERASLLASQAAVAIQNARIHALEEEEQHVQKDVVLVGFGQWGQKAYQHLLLLKNFFNFRTHVVETDTPTRRQALAEASVMVESKGDLFYWDSPSSPAIDALTLELEPSCYVITYIATPAETHLPLLKAYYSASSVILIEKPLGAPPDEYRDFLDHTDGSVQIVAADHYWFKTEVRLLQLLLTEERNLRSFLDDIEEVEIEILEDQPPSGSGAQIGMIADLIPHAFAVLSLLTPLDRLQLSPFNPLQIGRYQPQNIAHETYARLSGFFEHRGRQVKVTIDVGKGVADAKWIKLGGEKRMGGRKSFYKFDFIKGEAIDGTQGALRAATRPIRQPGVPDNAHLSMLRHVIEKKHPAVGILSIREALRANARIQQLESMAAALMASGQWTPYEQGQRPAFVSADSLQFTDAAVRELEKHL